jgi:transcriptional regulator with XRE-family HTH domain
MLDHLSKAQIARALDISKGYVYEIARGETIPYRRHWVKLAELVRFLPGE